MSQKSNLTDQLKELESIVEWFEQQDIDIEVAISQFEKGSELAEQIKEKLNELENNITVLKKRFDEPA